MKARAGGFTVAMLQYVSRRQRNCLSRAAARNGRSSSSRARGWAKRAALVFLMRRGIVGAIVGRGYLSETRSSQLAAPGPVRDRAAREALEVCMRAAEEWGGG